MDTLIENRIKLLEECCHINYELFSFNRAIPFEYIKKNLDKPWNWNILSRKRNITFKDVLDTIDQPWHFGLLSENRSITLQDVLEHPEFSWNWTTLSLCQKTLCKTPRDTSIFNIVSMNPDKPWSWLILSTHQSIKIEFILKFPNKPWHWQGLSQNESISFQDILDNPDLPWDWNYVSLNQSISFDDFMNNKSMPWNYNNLIMNSSILTIRSTDSDYINCVNRHMAAKRIQKYWLISLTNPAYIICQRRLKNEFLNLSKLLRVA